MKSYSRVRAIVVGLLVGAGLGEGAIQAQPLPQSGNTNAELNRQKHLQEGSDHFNHGEYLAAYEAFSTALALKPTAGVAAQLASCLVELGRYEEALTQYESVLRDFPNALKTRTKVTEEIQKLQEKVGTIGVSGQVPEGAAKGAAAAMVLASLGAAAWLDLRVAAVALAYLLKDLAYPLRP